MGFNLYLAGGDSVPLELTKEDNVGILTTFADGAKAVRKFIEKRHCKTFCDSGAYGAAHSGKAIDIDNYIDFINTTPDCDVFAVLDEIPWPTLTPSTSHLSSNNTWKNYCYMIEHVKPEYLDKLVCAFHYGEPLDDLLRLIDGYKGYKPKYIAFGGRAGVSTKNLYHYFDHRFWPTIEKSSNPTIKIHAFGVTVFDMVEKYPWYSADSIHSRFLNRVLNISDQRKTDLNHISSLHPDLYKGVMEEIESRGYKLEDLVKDYKLRHVWNCQYYKDWADNFVYKGSKIRRKNSLIKEK